MVLSLAENKFQVLVLYFEMFSWYIFLFQQKPY